MIFDNPQSPPRIRLSAGIGLAQLNPDQINHRFPIWSDEVDMGRRMVIRINDEPQAVQSEDCWHEY